MSHDQVFTLLQYLVSHAVSIHHGVFVQDFLELLVDRDAATFRKIKLAFDFKMTTIIFLAQFLILMLTKMFIKFAHAKLARQKRCKSKIHLSSNLIKKISVIYVTHLPVSQQFFQLLFASKIRFMNSNHHLNNNMTGQVYR